MNKFIFSSLLLCAILIPRFLSAQQVYDVTSTLDDNSPGTLRNIVAQAANGDVIRFDAGLEGDSIILNSEIYIDKSLTFEGITNANDELAFTIRVPVTYQDSLANSISPSSHRLFHINAPNDRSISVSFSNLILKGGAIQNNPTIAINGGSTEHNNNGGIILIRRDNDAVTLNNVTLAEARAYYGGAIYANGPMVLKDCSFEYNYAVDGGALYDNSQTISSIGLTFLHNHAVNEGGAVYEAYSANFYFTDCYFAFNTAGTDGAALHTGNSSRAFIEECSFYRNVATASGGALQNANVCTMTIENCTFVENRAKNGGAIFNTNEALLIAVNSTFTANAANDPSGDDEGRGGAIHITSSKPTTLINNVIAGNYVGTDPTAVKTEVLYVGETEQNTPSMLNMAYCIYGIIMNDGGKINYVENSQIEETETDEFMLEIYNARWAQDADDKWILVNDSTGVNIYDMEKHVVPISPYGRAAFQGTLVAKTIDGDSIEYFFRDFRDNDGPNRDEDDNIISEEVNKWMSFSRDTTYAYVDREDQDYGLNVLPQQVEVLTMAQNDVSRVQIDVAYNVGAYALNLEEPGVIVDTNRDILNPFDGLISLRDAAEAYVGTNDLGNRITFSPTVFSGDGVTDTIKIRERNIRMNRGMYIIGNGTDKVILDGQNERRVIAIDFSNHDTIGIRDITIQNGYTDQYGGGIRAMNGTLFLRNMIIRNCYAMAAGGMHLYMAENSTIYNVLFEANKARDNGAGVYNEATDSLSYINCTFVKNEITQETWVSVAMHQLEAYPYVVNTVMWGNEICDGCTVIGDANGKSEYNYYNSLFEGDENPCHDCLPSDTDPEFVDFDGGDYRPDRCSPLIDEGLNSFVLTDIDLALETRIINDTVDIGAYEQQNPVPPVAIWSPENNPLGTDEERQDWDNQLN